MEFYLPFVLTKVAGCCQMTRKQIMATLLFLSLTAIYSALGISTKYQSHDSAKIFSINECVSEMCQTAYKFNIFHQYQNNKVIFPDLNVTGLCLPCSLFVPSLPNAREKLPVSIPLLMSLSALIFDQLSTTSEDFNMSPPSSNFSSRQKNFTN